MTHGSRDEEGKERSIADLRAAFLDHICGTIWRLERQSELSVRERLEVLAHSICAALDGVACDLPGFVVMPQIADGDAEWCRENGYDWWPSFAGDTSLDIIGGDMLHDEFSQRMKGYSQAK